MFCWSVVISSFVNLLKLFVILCIGGIAMIVIGLILDDGTFWFASDVYSIVILGANTLVLYKAIIFIRTLNQKNKN